MGNEQHSPPASAKLEGLIETFKTAMRKGENPSIQDYASNNPNLSDTILDIFPTIQALEELKGHKEQKHLAQPSVTARLSHLGEYQLIKEIGRGGMGIVYEALQPSLGRKVAIKTLPWLKQADKTTLKRFQQEARIAASLEYPNIISILEMGEQEGIHYYAMRHIDGFGLNRLITHLSEYGLALNKDHQLLAELIRQVQNPTNHTNSGNNSSDSSKQVHSSLPHEYYKEIAHLISLVAKALHYAHSQGAFHRDIKPANLLLDQHGMIWISDFGLATSATSETLTRTQDMLGTLRYMAPERFEGDDNDARSDIYSLGLCLYELVTLQPAYSGQSGNLMYRILKGESTPPRQINPHIPPALEAIISKAIRVNPAARYQSCQELEKDLTDFVQHFAQKKVPDQHKPSSQNETLQTNVNSAAKQPQNSNPASKAWRTIIIYPFLIGIGISLGYWFIQSEKPTVSPGNESESDPQTNIRSDSHSKTPANPLNQDPQAISKNPQKTALKAAPQITDSPQQDEVIVDSQYDKTSSLKKAPEVQNIPPETKRTQADNQRQPPPRKSSGEFDGNEQQFAKVAEILSRFNPNSLTARDAKAINQAFREAGVRRGPSQTEAVRAAGFSPETIRRLDPPPGRPAYRGPPPRD